MARIAMAPTRIATRPADESGEFGLEHVQRFSGYTLAAILIAPLRVPYSICPRGRPTPGDGVRES
jgi:hypothetical protein